MIVTIGKAAFEHEHTRLPGGVGPYLAVQNVVLTHRFQHSGADIAAVSSNKTKESVATGMIMCQAI
jgi:hypothetical protein